MKSLVLAAVLSLLATGAQAASCKQDATEKKLHGAALTSFLKKCENDAKAKCTGDSDARKLSGAARNSHMKKCVTDAVGT